MNTSIARFEPPGSGFSELGCIFEGRGILPGLIYPQLLSGSIQGRGGSTGNCPDVNVAVSPAVAIVVGNHILGVLAGIIRGGGRKKKIGQVSKRGGCTRPPGIECLYWPNINVGFVIAHGRKVIS